MDSSRIETFQYRLDKIGHLPGTKAYRLSVVAAPTISALVGGDFTPIEPNLLMALRRDVWFVETGGLLLGN